MAAIFTARFRVQDWLKLQSAYHTWLDRLVQNDGGSIKIYRNSQDAAQVLIVVATQDTETAQSVLASFEQITIGKLAADDGVWEELEWTDKTQVK